ncbi:MAG: TetR/AcrR family transcriptional regulator C-terminal domain-containing protein [Myxococcota bacterium]
MARHRPDKSETRRRIVDASIEVFAERGLYASRISDIARAADVAEGTIYLYFKSKDDILVSVFREKMAEILARFQKMIAEIDDPEEQLRRYVTGHLALVAEQPKLMQVLTVELRQSTRFMKEQRPQGFARYLAVLASIISEGQRRGHFRRELKPALVGRAIFGAIDEIALAWVLGGGADALAEAHAGIAHELAELILRGLSLRALSTAPAPR